VQRDNPTPNDCRFRPRLIAVRSVTCRSGQPLVFRTPMGAGVGRHYGGDDLRATLCRLKETMKTCAFCSDEIHHAATFCKSYSCALPFPDSMPSAPLLLGITMWLTWTVRPTQSASERLAQDAAAPISIVSYRRLMSIGSRLEVKAEPTQVPMGTHQLVRFNVYNLGEASMTLCAVALKTLNGEASSAGGTCRSKRADCSAAKVREDACHGPNVFSM
jgi:hypothetical protein